MATIKAGQPRHLSSDEAYAMVEERYGKETEISDACAVTIASWWQAPRGPGYAMAQLASTGTVDYQEFLDGLRETRKEAVLTLQHPLDVQALDMLGTWALVHVMTEESS